jgi:HAE1 family hydrophobic/amphiphilic exporter-1
MYLFGFSLNLMTLMALSLVVGILVDDSIVVLENIYRHMEMGKNKRQAALDGRSEIGFTAIAITLVDVVVFVPLAFAGGLIGNILREFSLVVVASTLMSLFVSFTVTPLLASRFGKLEHLNKSNLWGRINLAFENLLDNIKEQYGKILTWSLGHKRWIFGATLVLLIGSFTLLGKGFIGASFISNGDRGELSVKQELASDASLYKTNQLVQQTEKMLLSKPEVVKVFSNVGYSSTGAGGDNSNQAELTVIMTDKDQRSISADDFGLKIRDVISRTPGVKVTVNPVGITGNASQANIDIAIKGTDMKQIREVATMVKQVVTSVPGTEYVKFSTKDPKPEIDIKLDRERMSQLGVDAGNVGLVLQNAFRGNNTSKFKEGGNEYDIMVSVDKLDKTNINDVRRLTFVNNQGQVFTLQDFATVSETMGESMLERTDRLSTMKVQATVIGRPSGTVGADIQKILDGKKLPDGITIEYGGDMKNQAQAFGSLGLALMLAILLVYLIMVALYESLVYPFVVLFAIPVATVGAFLALALTMESLSIFSIVGMIMLIGLVTKNAILIVDFANQLKSEGYSVKEALIEAGKERLRPILMTTIAMIVGMLPIALATGAGAEVKNGMAWVIIGGLSSSLLLTLVVVPSVYMVVDKMLAKIAKIKRFRFIRNERTELAKARVMA